MNLLIIEDNDGLRDQMKWALNDTFTVYEASTTKQAIDIFSKNSCQLVCLDLGLDNIPDKGVEVLDQLLLINRNTKIVIITAHTDASLGNEAVKRGAFDYLKKPIDIEELKVILSRAQRLLGLEESMEEIPTSGIETGPDFTIVGECQAMQKVFTAIQRLSQTDVNVLITGESGTGKELCARAIHFHSNRKETPFVPINCGAIPDTLLESELFGYAKGAFTGAQTNKAGLIASAESGTLFLDEIGDMPKPLQAKLLRFLEDQTYQRLGDVTLHKANVRIIAATNRKNLSEENNATMRTDLYYRLSEYELTLPPIRERESDILILAQSIIQKNQRRFNLPRLKMSTRSEKLLTSYSWPGNVRELENKLGRAAISCENQVIEPEDLELAIESLSNVTYKEAKNLFEKNFILAALRQADNNISKAAQSIDVSRPTLYDMMKKHGIGIKTELKIIEDKL